MKGHSPLFWGLLCVVLPAALRADVVSYSFNGTYSGYSVSISFNTFLTGSQLDNLNAANITPKVSNFTETNTIPGSGFTVSEVLLSTDALGNITAFSITSTNGTVVTGTFDSVPAGIYWTAPPKELAGFALGQHSDIAGIIFASYPTAPGQDPNEFFCEFTDTTGVLVLDKDDGFCPTTAVENTATATIAAGSGTWMSVPANPGGTSTPEPAAWSLLGAGLLGVAGFRRLRNSR